MVFQITGFQRTGNPSVFIDGHPPMNNNGYPSMISIGDSSMIIIDGPSMNMAPFLWAPFFGPFFGAFLLGPMGPGTPWGLCWTVGWHDSSCSTSHQSIWSPFFGSLSLGPSLGPFFWAPWGPGRQCDPQCVPLLSLFCNGVPLFSNAFGIRHDFIHKLITPQFNEVSD